MDMNKTVLEAIALRKCLEATYNRVRIRLAPHILYTKHDQLYLDGVTLERDGKPPREIKVGAFKLDGLNDLALTDREFEVFQLIGQGKGTAAISAQLHLSPKTVDVHRSHIKEKLALRDATALIRHAVRWVETQQVG